MPLMVAMLAAAPSGGICWIVDVRTAPGGVRILFNRNGPLSVTTGDHLWLPRDAPATAADGSAAGLDAKLGDQLWATGGVHDNCVLRVEQQDGKIGVAAVADLSLPGLPASNANAFYAAHD